MARKLFIILLLELLFHTALLAQRRIEGTVTAADDGLPVIGASVLMEGTHLGTVTDINGHYVLHDVPSKAHYLRITYVGMTSQRLALADNLKIVLKSDATQLDDVVVVAYGTAKSRNLTASISSVKQESLRGVGGHSIDGMLEGQVAGLMISTPGSQVEQAPIIHVRGVSSISSGTTPLYVVDGMPINATDIASSTDYNPLADINPADIKSIDVLKDAAASAMYGSRAAAGVILITTHSGSANSRAKLDYDYHVGVNTATRLLKPMNALQYTELKNEGWLNNGGDPNKLPYATMTDANGQTVSTNWVDLIFRTGLSQSHNLNLQGGNDKATYYLSSSYTTQEGITIDATYDRFSFKGNGTYKANNFLKVGFNTSYSYSHIHTADDSRSGSLSSMGGLTRLAYVDLPNVPARNTDGSFYASTVSPQNLGKGNNAVEVFYYNALALVEGGQYAETKAHRILASGYAELTPLKGLTLRTQYGIDWSLLQNESFYTPLAGGGYSSGGSSTAGDTTLKTWTWTNTADYNFHLGHHHVDILIGTEATESRQNGFTRTGRTLSNSDQRYIEANYLTYGGSGTRYVGTMFSYISRLTYDWNNRYYLTANLRRDGLSRLGRKWGNFWGISGAWRISDEPFMQRAKSFGLEDLKLRASYGVVGNANVGWYASQSVYNASTYHNETSYISAGINDPNLGWEQTGTADIGFTASLFGGRLDVDVDYFYSKSKDLILNASQAYSSGIVGASVSTNLGKLGIHSLRLYFQAQNLFCLTGYSGFDPEINSYYNSANLRSGIDLNTTPLTRTFTFGANLTF